VTGRFRVKKKDMYNQLIKEKINFLMMPIKAFMKDNCLQLASSLSYVTIFSIVPLIAISFTAFKAFGALEGLENQVRKLILNNLIAEASSSVIKYIDEFISNIHSGAIGIGGFIGLIFLSLGLVNTIETSLNRIWEIEERKPLLTRLSAYWSIITLGPVFLGLSLYISAKLHIWKVLGRFVWLNFPERLIFLLLSFSLTWAAIVLIYVLIPNTRVKWKSAMIGGAVAAALFEVAKLGFNLYMAKVVLYKDIYGSLGILPIFLVWIFLSWVVFLFGAEVSYFVQNPHKLKGNVSHPRRTHLLCPDYLAIEVIAAIAKKFYDGERPLTTEELSKQFDLPVQRVEEIIRLLNERNIVDSVEGSFPGYRPAKPVEKIELRDLIRIFRDVRDYELDLDEWKPEENPILETFVKMNSALDKALEGITVKDLFKEKEKGVGQQQKYRKSKHPYRVQ